MSRSLFSLEDTAIKVNGIHRKVDGQWPHVAVIDGAPAGFEDKAQLVLAIGKAG